jgi:hypothetical protein
MTGQAVSSQMNASEKVIPDLYFTGANLLSCLMLDESGADTLQKCRDSGITENSFTNPTHSELYKLIADQHDAGVHHEIGIVLAQCHQNLLKEIIWLNGSETVKTSANASRFIADLRKAEGARALVTTALSFVEVAKSPDANPQTIVAEQIIILEALQQRYEPVFKPITAEELCAHPPPKPEEIIHGMLYVGGTCIISAPSKGHKTYTGLDIACAVSEGRDWLGFKTTATKTLYVNLELCPHSIERRISGICSARCVKKSSNLVILNLRGKRITLEVFKTQIMPLAKKLGVKLIIIDPYYKISAVSGVEENSNDVQADFLAEIEASTTDGNCALIMIHHFSKGDSGAKNSIDRASGGGVLARWPDAVITLTEHEKEDHMIAEFHLRDFAPVPRFVIRWDYPVWTMATAEDPAKVKRQGRKDEHPASVLLEKLDPSGMSNSEWQKASGWSQTTFKNKREQLEKEGKVSCVMNVWRPC